MTGLHDELRRRTASAHRTLDAAVADHGMLDSVAGYRQFLAGWYRLQASVESRLEANGVASILDDWPKRQRTHLLANDLQTLGAELPGLEPVPDGTLSTAGVLGTAYVVEGATLGAAVLLPRFIALGVEPRCATFLSQSTAASASLWPAFLATLQAHASRVDADAVIAAAEAAFAWARGCFVGPATKARIIRRRDARRS